MQTLRYLESLQWRLNSKIRSEIIETTIRVAFGEKPAMKLNEHKTKGRSRGTRAPRPGDRLREQIEKAIEIGDGELVGALRIWEGLPGYIQRLVVREIVETRQRELRQAYPDVIALAYGKRSRQRRTVDEECVTFLVERKWRRRGKITRSDARLPEYLLAYAPTPWSSERVLCAVPTDVESVEDGVPSPRGVGIDMVAPERSSPWNGAVSCAVQGPGGEGLYAVTCLHVAGMPDGEGNVISEAEARLFGNVTVLGRTSRDWIGRLVRPPTRSFDAALIEVSDEDRPSLRGAVDGFSASTSLRASEAIPLSCAILVPGRNKVEATYVQTWVDYPCIKYFDSDPQPVHARLFEFEVDVADAARGGDSGAAVVNDGGWQIVGMYLAGVDGTTRQFVLPAYYLFEGANYGKSGELKLVPAP